MFLRHLIFKEIAKAKVTSLTQEHSFRILTLFPFYT
jgi:hypothetical protein